MRDVFKTEKDGQRDWTTVSEGKGSTKLLERQLGLHHGGLAGQSQEA